MITLNEKEITDLKGFFMKMPTEFGMPLLQFFGQLEAAQKEVPNEEKSEE